MKELYQFILGAIFFTSPVNGIAQQLCYGEHELPSSTPTYSFLDHGDGTVTDMRTRLMWTKCPVGYFGTDCSQISLPVNASFNWLEAMEFASSSNYAGYVDWRLPNIKELRSIVEHRCIAPALNSEVFPIPWTMTFWSATPALASPDAAWTVYSYYGKASWDARDGNETIRLVRNAE